MNLDRVIHEPARLAILTLLYRVAKADFLYLQKKRVFTQGNFSRHLARLKAAGWVASEKKFKCHYPMTVCSLTKKGHKAFANYAEKLKGVPETAERKSGSKA